VKRSEIPDFVLNPTEEDGDLQKEQVPIHLRYSYKSTNTDAKGAAEYRATAADQFTCVTRTKVQILTQKALQSIVQQLQTAEQKTEEEAPEQEGVYLKAL